MSVSETTSKLLSTSIGVIPGMVSGTSVTEQWTIPPKMIPFAVPTVNLTPIILAVIIIAVSVIIGRTVVQIASTVVISTIIVESITIFIVPLLVAVISTNILVTSVITPAKSTRLATGLVT